MGEIDVWTIVAGAGLMCAILGAAVFFLACAICFWKHGERLGPIATILFGWGLLAFFLGCLARGNG